MLLTVMSWHIWLRKVIPELLFPHLWKRHLGNTFGRYQCWELLLESGVMHVRTHTHKVPKALVCFRLKMMRGNDRHIGGEAIARPRQAFLSWTLHFSLVVWAVKSIVSILLPHVASWEPKRVPYFRTILPVLSGTRCSNTSSFQSSSPRLNFRASFVGRWCLYMSPGDSPESISKDSESDDISEELREPYGFITDSLPLRA